MVLNEVAPRPHNSGHYTMEACAVDQFENHLRAVLGLPLGSGEMVTNAAIMLNVLGESEMQATMAPLIKVCKRYRAPERLRLQLCSDASRSQAMADGNGGIHWYGKEGTRAGRKMAHVTFVGASFAEVQRRAESIGIASVRPRCELLVHSVSPLLAKMNVSFAPNAQFGAPTPSVSIIMGSDSDLPTMKAAAEVLVEFGVPFEITIVSAHRTPQRMYTYGSEAASRGIKVPLYSLSTLLYRSASCAVIAS